jgi:hypothetical protein
MNKHIIAIWAARVFIPFLRGDEVNDMLFDGANQVCFSYAGGNFSCLG